MKSIDSYFKIKFFKNILILPLACHFRVPLTRMKRARGKLLLSKLVTNFGVAATEVAVTPTNVALNGPGGPL